MRSAGAAFAWELGRRHRWGWVAVAVWLGALLVARLWALASGRAFMLEWGVGAAFATVVPGTVTLFWLIVLFSHGGSGNIAARPSILPARLFTLPVTNTALAGWPMGYAAAVVTFLWLAVRVLGPWPDEMPYLWPGLLAVVLVGWTQALIWMSYPLPGLRVSVAVLWLAAVETAAVVAVTLEASEAAMLAIMAPLLPLAFVAARYAVARARRGEVADWTGVFSRLTGVGRRRESGARPFASADAAQLWLEWKRYGRSVPVMTAFVLPVELVILWASRDAPALVGTILLIAGLTPAFMASFTAIAVRKSGAGDDYGVSPFAATRPLSSAALVGARLRMAARSTALAWLLVLIAVPAALLASGTWGIVVERAGRFAAVVGTDRAIVAAVLVLTALILTTWRQMVQSLYLGLTGRPGLIKGTAFATLCLVVVIGPLLDWAWDRGLGSWFWIALYWVLGVIVAARAVLGCWIAIRLRRDRLVSERALVIGAALWLGLVALAYAVLLWWWSTPYEPRFQLLLLATVSVPLVRLSAAPLALAWNRHR